MLGHFWWPTLAPTAGIGAWGDIFETISYLAILVNAGLAVFNMEPFRDWDLQWKLLAFLAGCNYFFPSI